MNIIKEVYPNNAINRNGVVCGTGGQYIVRTNTYNKTVEHIYLLFNVLKKDFPDITMEDVTLTHYSGDRYSGTIGLEVNIPEVIKWDETKEVDRSIIPLVEYVTQVTIHGYVKVTKLEFIH